MKLILDLETNGFLDIDNLVIDQEIGELYVQNMVDLLSKLEDINAGYIKID